MTKALEQDQAFSWRSRCLQISAMQSTNSSKDPPAVLEALLRLSDGAHHVGLSCAEQSLHCQVTERPTRFR